MENTDVDRKRFRDPMLILQGQGVATGSAELCYREGNCVVCGGKSGMKTVRDGKWEMEVAVSG